MDDVITRARQADTYGRLQQVVFEMRAARAAERIVSPQQLLDWMTTIEDAIRILTTL